MKNLHNKHQIFSASELKFQSEKTQKKRWSFIAHGSNVSNFYLSFRPFHLPQDFDSQEP